MRQGMVMAGMKRQFAKRTTLTESRYLKPSHQGKLLVPREMGCFKQTSGFRRKPRELLQPPRLHHRFV